MVTAAWPGTRAEAGSLLVKIYPGRDNPPLFWAGSPDVLDSFNQQFDGDRPIYCMSTTWEVIQPTEFNIKSLALYYVSEILKVQPSGPYLLGGFCEAGAITFEIAALLTELGHKIDLLAFCEREVTKRSKAINFFKATYQLRENMELRLIHFMKNPWQCIKEVMHSKMLQIKKLIKSLLDFFYKSKKTPSEPSEPIYKLSQQTTKIHLIYVKWGLLGFYRFNFFQKYWNEIALGGTQFYIINGRWHNRPDWNKVAEIVKQLIDDVSLNKAE
jgi:hypothetical protein